MKNKKIFIMTQFAILLAIEALFCFTPLGSLPIGPIVATLALIPVVITAILLGPKLGTVMGFITGAFSLIVWTFMPPNPATAFAFSPFYSLGEFKGNFGSLLICFVPRILAGTVTGLVNKAMLKRNPKKEVLSYTVSAVAGSLLHTFGVLGGIILFFSGQYETVFGEAILVLAGTTVLTNGIPEAIIAALAAAAICKPLNSLNKKI